MTNVFLDQNTFKDGGGFLHQPCFVRNINHACESGSRCKKGKEAED